MIFHACNSIQYCVELYPLFSAHCLQLLQVLNAFPIEVYPNSSCFCVLLHLGQRCFFSKFRILLSFSSEFLLKYVFHSFLFNLQLLQVLYTFSDDSLNDSGYSNIVLQLVQYWLVDISWFIRS
ncbi:16721_t:CDS:1, partial [Dentiscutata heterogama]